MTLKWLHLEKEEYDLNHRGTEHFETYLKKIAMQPIQCLWK